MEPNPDQIHAEGPASVVPVTISTNINVRDAKPATDTAECRMQEYDLLTKQVADGLYDGDGPADVAETCQERTC